MSPLEQLIMKKMQSGAKMDPMEQKAKMSNLDALKAEMHGMMKGHLEPQGAKVEVAASSPEGLKAGLDKAQDVVGDDDEESPDHEASESPEDEKMEDGSMDGEMAHGELSDDELDMLKKLLMKAGKI